MTRSKMISMLSTLACMVLFFLSACGAVEGGAKMCTQDTDCSSGFSCKPGAKYKTCQPNSGGEVECRIPSDCALDGSKGCIGGKCTDKNMSPMCRIQSDCGTDGTKTCTNGVCTSNGTGGGVGASCTKPDQCAPGHTCRMGKCALNDCTIDGCAAGYMCNPVTKWCEQPMASSFYTCAVTCTSNLNSAHMYVEGMAVAKGDHRVNCTTYSGADWKAWKELGTTPAGAGPFKSVTATFSVPVDYEPRFEAYAQDAADGSIVRYAGAKATAGNAYDPSFVCTAVCDGAARSIYRVIDGNGRGGDLLQVTRY